MQSLFQNESIGRVLVSDYTTKAEFIIPDLNKVLGPEKYKIVDQDIKEALQNVVVGHERYSNTQVKAQIFLERLKEARSAFLTDFLQPQVKLVCQNMGFRKYPLIRFQEIDIKDEVQLQRVTTRLMELGLLTPEQGIQTIKTGLYPPNVDVDSGQKQYLEDRKKGYYTPLVGGQPLVPEEEEEGDGQPTNTNQPESKRPTVQDTVDDKGIEPGAGPVTVGRPNKKTSKETGRPTGAPNNEKMALADRRGIQDTVYKTEGLFSFAQKEMKSAKEKKILLEDLCKTVVVSSDAEKWEENVSDCIRDFNKIEKLSALPEILEASQEHQIELYPAALYYHSQYDKRNSQKEK
jgi:hypothetical protein